MAGIGIGSVPDIIVRDKRKEKEAKLSRWAEEAEVVKGDIVRYEISGDVIWFYLDTGYEIRVDIRAIAEAINKMISEKILDRLEGRK